jgi:hypothetical protein
MEWAIPLPQRARRKLFCAVCELDHIRPPFPGAWCTDRAAQADFNVRGWQGRWRYTALTALFFMALSWLPDYPKPPPPHRR